MRDEMFPDTVYILWRITVVLAIVVFVPLSVNLLYGLLRSARSVRNYSREILAASQAIQVNTAAIPATNVTIAVGTELVEAAESAGRRLDAMASALEARRTER